MKPDIDYYKAQREELVDQAVMDLIRNGGEYDPFHINHINHISEALNELPTDEIEALQEFCDDARYPSSNSTDATMAKIGRLIYVDIYNYWEKMAVAKAERETPSAEELLGRGI